MDVIRLRDVTAGAVLVRLVGAVGAVAVLLATADLRPVPVIVFVAGVLLSLADPARVGAWLALPAAAWVFAAGTAPDVGTGPVLLAAAGVYLLHTGTAAGAAVPWSARVEPAVARRWLGRCAPAVVLTLVLAGLDAGLGTTPRSSLFAVAAAVAVLLAAAALVRLLGGTRTGH